MNSEPLKCEVCGTVMQPIPPPFPPQFNNGPIVSAVTMLNGRAECTQCGAKYVTQIANAQLNLGFARVQEQSRIVEPSAVERMAVNKTQRIK